MPPDWRPTAEVLGPAGATSRGRGHTGVESTNQPGPSAEGSGPGGATSRWRDRTGAGKEPNQGKKRRDGDETETRR